MTENELEGNNAVETDGRFKDEVVFIVGAAGGIGEATCQRFVASGATVVAADRDAGVEAVAQATGVIGAGGSTRILDITDPGAVERVVASVIEEYDRVDHLVVLAGVLHAASPVETLELDEWRRMLDINLTGPFVVARSVVPYMKERQKGTIVNIGSWYGHSGHGFFSAYCASKAGLIVFTQALADEVATDGIRANVICPGNVNTSMHHDALRTEAIKRGVTFEEMRDIEWEKIPLREAGDPSTIADGVAFLCSDAASYITGTSLDINGGVMYR